MPIAFLLSNWRLVALAAGVVALLGWAGCERLKLIHEGEQRAVQKIEEANHEAEQKADIGAKSTDECFARGGNWDRASGRCLPNNPAR